MQALSPAIAIVPASLLVSLALVPLFARAADGLGLVDRPDERKRHAGEVPLVGGLAIVLAVLVASVLPGEPVRAAPVLVGVMLGLALLGATDDLLGLRASTRFAAQALLVGVAVGAGDLRVDSVGALLGAAPVELGPTFGAAFTVLCTLGAINAINMVDGVDGLSGTLVSLSLLAMAWLASGAGLTAEALFLLAATAACFGFLYYNARWFRGCAVVFMGDAGSTALGFVLVWFFIELSQGPTAAMTPVVAGWLFGLPLADTVSVMVRRLAAGRSPFRAGRDHVHHQLLDRGLGPRATVAVLAAVQAGFIGLGLLANDRAAAQPLLFWGFVAIVVAHHFGTPRLLDRLVGAPVRA